MFSWDEGCKVTKLLLGAKESNEEERVSEGDDWSLLALEEECFLEVSFLFFLQKEIEVLADSERSDSMDAREGLDSNFLLKIDLTLIPFPPEVPFFE